MPSFGNIKFDNLVKIFSVIATKLKEFLASFNKISAIFFRRRSKLQPSNETEKNAVITLKSKFIFTYP